MSTVAELQAKLERMPNAALAEVYKEMLLIGVDAVGNIKQRLSSGAQGGPRSRTGLLSRSIQSKVLNIGDEVISLQVGVFGGVPYARALEEGSKAHRILATVSRALRFRVQDRFIFRKSVQHPGNRAYHFISDEAKATEVSARERLQAAALRGLYGA